MADENATERDDRVQRECDDDLTNEIESHVDEHAARLKHCLTALRAASVPLDLVTASALQELGARMGSIIHEILADE